MTEDHILSRPGWRRFGIKTNPDREERYRYIGGPRPGGAIRQLPNGRWAWRAEECAPYQGTLADPHLAAAHVEAIMAGVDP